MFKDSIGYMMHGCRLHLHKDTNSDDENLIHTRFNVYVNFLQKAVIQFIIINYLD